MQRVLASLPRNVIARARGFQSSPISRAGGHDASDPHAGKVKLGPLYVKSEHVRLNISFKISHVVVNPGFILIVRSGYSRRLGPRYLFLPCF